MTGAELERAMQPVLGALGRNDIAGATALAETALAGGAEHPLLFNLAAFSRENEGRFDEALALLRRAVSADPGDVLALTALGSLLTRMGRAGEAIAPLEGALEIFPDHAPAHHALGLAQAAQERMDEALVSHQNAARLDPNYPDPLGTLAEHALSKGDAAEAKRLAERGLSLDPGLAPAALVLAAVEAADGARDGAIARLRALLNRPLAPLHRSAALQLLGEQLDGAGDAEAAFDAFTEANALLRGIYGPVFTGAGTETAIPLCARLKGYFEGANPDDWAPAPGGEGLADGGLGHAFLVGFVRSGTTLLEQVLASHPDVVALEEQPTLRDLITGYFDDADGLDRLSRLTAAEADQLRSAYWAKVRELGVDPVGKVFVDKAPLSTLWLPMVAKLFPRAKIILAIRDPRDVTLSAFRHRFLINALAWPFTDLQDTARFYAGLMDVAAVYRRVLPLALYQHKHEDLIADFDAETRRIAEFLGIGWTEQMRDFTETARRRDVRTPSKEQVRRGLNSDGMGRWRRYGPGVEPIFDILAHWVRAYGYEGAPDA